MKAIHLLLILAQFFTPEARAVGKYSINYDGKTPADQGQSSVSEFVFQSNPNDVLINVYLLGAVNKPGLYHVPANTDIFSLLSLAGGTSNEAEMSHILIKHRPFNRPMLTTELDLEKAVADSAVTLPDLAVNDVILIPNKQPAVSNNTVLVVGLVATVLTIVFAGIIVSQNSKK